MAEKKTIELEIKSNVGESISDLKALKRQLKDTAAGSEEFKKLYNQIDDLEDKIKSSKNASSDWIDSLESAGGPLGMLGGGLNKAKVATQSFGGALKATGIGLFVSLIAGLVAAFQDNENAMKKIQPLLNGLQKVFQGVFRAVEPLFNTLVDLAIGALPMVSKAMATVYSSVTAVFQSLGSLGSAIGKLVKGDFSGAWKDAKSSVTDFSKNYDASIKRFNSGTKEMTATEKEEAEKRAEARKAADEKRKAQQEKSKQAAIQKAKEEADALKKIEEDRIAKEMASAQEVLDKERSLIQAQETPLQKEEREYQEWLIKYQANNLNTELLTKQHLDNVANITKTEAEKKAADTKARADKEIADAKAKEDKITADKKAAEEARRNINNIAIQSAQGLVGILAGLGEKNKKLQKAALIANGALSIAEIINNTNVGSAKEVATKGIFGLSTSAVLYAKMAISIGSVIAATAKGLSALGGGGSVSSGGSSTPASAPAAPAFNVVGASSTNQLAQTIGNQQQQPIKAYVVANDVTTQQSLDRNIVQSASIG